MASCVQPCISRPQRLFFACHRIAWFRRCCALGQIQFIDSRSLIGETGGAGGRIKLGRNLVENWGEETEFFKTVVFHRQFSRWWGGIKNGRFKVHITLLDFLDLVEDLIWIPHLRGRELCSVLLAPALYESGCLLEHRCGLNVREVDGIRDLPRIFIQLLARQVWTPRFVASQEFSCQIHSSSCTLLGVEGAQPHLLVDEFPLLHSDLRDPFLQILPESYSVESRAADLFALRRWLRLHGCTSLAANWKGNVEALFLGKKDEHDKNPSLPSVFEDWWIMILYWDNEIKF